jgi:glycosyltransferase involved in cell wall biosynthesis
MNRMEELRSNRPAQVSIIIPARNEEKSLGDLLASLQSLDFPRDKFEVVVVDHESTDRTAEIALAAGARVVKKSGGNISSARNFGASQAAGQILAFLDADCTVAEDWLSRALAHFADPEVGAVGSYHIIPLDPPTWVRIVLQKQAAARPKLANATWLPSGNMLIRREVFLECNGFDESLGTCEDVDLSYRITRKYRLIADSDIRCWHHREPASLLQLFRKELWRGHDNLAGAFRHGLRLAEIPSLVLPLYVIVTFVLFLLSPAIAVLSGWGTLTSIFLFGTAVVLPVLAWAALVTCRSGDLRYLPHLTAFYGVYFFARGLAAFYRPGRLQG